MAVKITTKVEGGKLLRLELELTEDLARAKSVKLSGDFFIHPEDSLQIIEKALLTAPIDQPMLSIAGRIGNLTVSQGIQMIGINPESIANAFTDAVRLAKGNAEIKEGGKEASNLKPV
ncbi:MAG: hypothetical protein ABIG96_05195 [Candidatus Micrarchaeota archaeon]